MFFESCSYLYFSFGIFVNFYDFFLFTIEVTVLTKLSCSKQTLGFAYLSFTLDIYNICDMHKLT